MGTPRQSSRSKAIRTDRVATIVTAPVAALGLDLEAVEVTPAGKRSLVRIAVDRDGDLTLDHLAEATRVISAALDADDPFGDQPYTLEVTSRGVDRPLTLPRHWHRNRGRLVEVRRSDAEPITGRIVGSDDDGADLEHEQGRVRVSYAEVTRALIVIEFNRAGDQDGEDG